MLVSLTVKNLAIIDEEEIEFGKGLNILSGETGAGKSIILGALSLAMGERIPKGLIRDESKEALAEAVFTLNESQKSLLEEMDIDVSEGQLILHRKISPTRSASKINGESVPAAKMSKAADILIDIYGQHEQQTLLSKKNHIKLLDDFAGEELSGIKSQIAIKYDSYKSLKEELMEANLDQGSREREVDLLSHEIAEIESANLTPGEDVSLMEEFKLLSKSEKILEAVAASAGAISSEPGDSLERAIRLLNSVEDANPKLKSIASSLSDADAIIADAKRDLEDFMDSLELSPEHLESVSKRVDLIDSLKRKYSKNDTIEEVLRTLDESIKKRDKLLNYEEYLKKLNSDLTQVKDELDDLCSRASSLRKKAGEALSLKVSEALLDLNFMEEGFSIVITDLEEPNRTGKDEVEFYISTNPGEPERPLNEIASGGELSRIMLAIKTIFAGEGEIDTLVFDEIDSGVSGKTAARVAARLASLSGESQVICITHLPQIAAKANAHFLIEKRVEDGVTKSSIRPLGKEERVTEVARMLAGDDITPAAIENARNLMS